MELANWVGMLILGSLIDYPFCLCGRSEQLTYLDWPMICQDHALMCSSTSGDSPWIELEGGQVSVVMGVGDCELNSTGEQASHSQLTNRQQMGRDQTSPAPLAKIHFTFTSAHPLSCNSLLHLD